MDDLTFAGVCSARDQIGHFIRRTPLEDSPLLAMRTGARSVCFKREDLQRNGTFKIRGMANRLRMFTPGTRVSIGSCGGAGIASADLSRELRLRTCVVTPSYTTQQKAHEILRFGAAIRRCGDIYDESRDAAFQMRKHGWLAVDVDEDPKVIAGHGTIALGLFQYGGEFPDVIVLPVGGGGLLAGVTLAAKAINPQVRVVGVQSEASQPWIRSMRAGKVTEAEYVDSIAEGLIGGISPLCFDIAKSFLSPEDFVLVSETDIVNAMRWTFEEHSAMIEPTAAVVIAALLTGKIDVKGKNVAAIISGGNIDPMEFSKIIYKDKTD